MAVSIVTDSTSDIPTQIAQELGITVVPLNVHFGEETYRERVDLSDDEFFRKLAASPVLPKTSQPSAGDFQMVYERLAEESDGILSVHLSSKLSGTLNSALVAREAIGNRCRIEIVDSLSASMGLGLQAIAAARAAREGASLDAVAALCRELVPKTHIELFVDTLEYLEKGGRIGKAQAFLGSLLNVKPILDVVDGEIHPIERVRTRRKAVEKLYEFATSFRNVREMAIIHSTTPEEAAELAQRIHPTYPQERIYITRYGPVLGVHLGPGALGVIVQEE